MTLLKKALIFLLECGTSLGKVSLLWLSISKVTHDNVKGNNLVRFWEQGLLVIWYQVEVIEVVKLIDEGWVWVRFRVIVDEPSCHVPVQAIRDNIKERLIA